MIFNIQRYPTHDGPGIRTVVFLKGRSLDCRWYQNPKSHARTRGLLHDLRPCLGGCKLRAKTALEMIECALNGLLIHREKLTPEYFTALTDCCPTQTLTVCGEVKSAEGTMATVLHDKSSCDRSGGDLTLSGGEPLTQLEAATALLQTSHKTGVHTAVETYLHVPWRYITPSLPYIDLLLADLKHAADAPFKQWTDGNAVRVLDSPKKLATAGKKIITHAPLIQGFNADEASTKTITDFAVDKLHVSEIHFLSYYTLGINKCHLLNLSYDAPEKLPDAPELLDSAQWYTCQKGLAATLRGQQS